MPPTAPTDDRVYVCDGCDKTYLGAWTHLIKTGWVRHILRGGRELLLCHKCEPRPNA